MTARFRYEIDPQGQGTIVLQKLVGHNIVASSDGPFSPATHSGSWAELRDASDRTLHTRGVYHMVPESVEAYSDDGFSMGFSCPTEGSFSVNNLPNDPAGTQVVLFAEAINGVMTNQTIELARVTLP